MCCLFFLLIFGNLSFFKSISKSPHSWIFFTIIFLSTRPLLKPFAAVSESSQRMRTQKACHTRVESLTSYPQKTREQRSWEPGYSPEWNLHTRVRSWSICRLKEKSPPWWESWVWMLAVFSLSSFIHFCSFSCALLLSSPLPSLTAPTDAFAHTHTHTHS